MVANCAGVSVKVPSGLSELVRSTKLVAEALSKPALSVASASVTAVALPVIVSSLVMPSLALTPVSFANPAVRLGAVVATVNDTATLVTLPT
jgi:hypothetical protein